MCGGTAGPLPPGKGRPGTHPSAGVPAPLSPQWAMWGPARPRHSESAESRSGHAAPGEPGLPGAGLRECTRDCGVWGCGIAPGTRGSPCGSRLRERAEGAGPRGPPGDSRLRERGGARGLPSTPAGVLGCLEPPGRKCGGCQQLTSRGPPARSPSRARLGGGGGGGPQTGPSHRFLPPPPRRLPARPSSHRSFLCALSGSPRLFAFSPSPRSSPLQALAGPPFSVYTHPPALRPLSSFSVQPLDVLGGSRPRGAGERYRRVLGAPSRPPWPSLGPGRDPGIASQPLPAQGLDSPPGLAGGARPPAAQPRSQNPLTGFWNAEGGILKQGP